MTLLATFLYSFNIRRVSKTASCSPTHSTERRRTFVSIIHLFTFIVSKFVSYFYFVTMWRRTFVSIIYCFGMKQQPSGYCFWKVIVIFCKRWNICGANLRDEKQKLSNVNHQRSDPFYHFSALRARIKDILLSSHSYFSAKAISLYSSTRVTDAHTINDLAMYNYQEVFRKYEGMKIL